MIGTIIKTKNYGLAKIIGKGTKYNYYKVQFKNTNNIDEFRIDAVKKGEIRDKYAVTFCEVGIIGNIKTRGKYKPFYNIWKNIIYRCYTPHNKAYYNKVKICDRWKTFEYFYSDITKVDGWNENEFKKGNLVLDKDLKQQFENNKVYSPSTCTWISVNQNSKIQDAQQRWFIAISPKGEHFKSRNISEFARNHNLERRQISAVLHKKYNTTNGWMFKYVDEEIV